MNTFAASQLRRRMELEQALEIGWHKIQRGEVVTVDDESGELVGVSPMPPTL